MKNISIFDSDFYASDQLLQPPPTPKELVGTFKGKYGGAEELFGIHPDGGFTQVLSRLIDKSLSREVWKSDRTHDIMDYIHGM